MTRLTGEVVSLNDHLPVLKCLASALSACAFHHVRACLLHHVPYLSPLLHYPSVTYLLHTTPPMEGNSRRDRLLCRHYFPFRMHLGLLTKDNLRKVGPLASEKALN